MHPRMTYFAVLGIAAAILMTPQDAPGENLHKKWANWDCSRISLYLERAVRTCKHCEAQGMDYFRTSDNSGHCVPSARARGTADPPRSSARGRRGSQPYWEEPDDDYEARQRLRREEEEERRLQQEDEEWLLEQERLLARQRQREVDAEAQRLLEAREKAERMKLKDPFGSQNDDKADPFQVPTTAATAVPASEENPWMAKCRKDNPSGYPWHSSVACDMSAKWELSARVARAEARRATTYDQSEAQRKSKTSKETPDWFPELDNEEPPAPVNEAPQKPRAEAWIMSKMECEPVNRENMDTADKTIDLTKDFLINETITASPVDTVYRVLGLTRFFGRKEVLCRMKK